MQKVQALEGSTKPPESFWQYSVFGFCTGRLGKETVCTLQTGKCNGTLLERWQIMHRYKWSCSQQLHLSCFSHVFYPFYTKIQGGFWVLLSVTFQGNCTANSVFSWSASARCINWVLWLCIFQACSGVPAMVPLLSELVTLCLRKVAPIFYTSFVCGSWSAVLCSQIPFCPSI